MLFCDFFGLEQLSLGHKDQNPSITVVENQPITTDIMLIVVTINNYIIVIIILIIIIITNIIFV